MSESSIDEIVAAFLSHRELVERFMKQLATALGDSSLLAPHIHSIKARVKDPVHLRGKLLRKLAAHERDGTQFEISPENVLSKVTDLAGIRILHLHTTQVRDIDRVLQAFFEEQQYHLREGPFARTWDDESRRFFRDCGITTQDSPTLYTSVHYIVESASKTTIACEVQVRTLMEEVWGEVDHLINYPAPAQSIACREQLKVLARVTSSASSLVDAIFLTWQEEVAGRQERSDAARGSGA
jgi:putative GTP pyrophosphokinase